jgi:hypothetical protein
MDRTLLEALVFQRDHHIDGNVYKACQCDFAYNSNHIEGSTLTHDQTVQIFDRATFSGTAAVDDIVEARNHFRAFDHVLDTWDEPLSPDYLRAMHRILKSGTAYAANPVMSVGEFKKFSNVIGGAVSDVETASPEDVLHLVGDLIDSREGKSVRQFEGVCKRHGLSGGYLRLCPGPLRGHVHADGERAHVRAARHLPFSRAPRAVMMTRRGVAAEGDECYHSYTTGELAHAG